LSHPVVSTPSRDSRRAPRPAPGRRGCDPARRSVFTRSPAMDGLEIPARSRLHHRCLPGCARPTPADGGCTRIGRGPRTDAVRREGVGPRAARRAQPRARRGARVPHRSSSRAPSSSCSTAPITCSGWATPTPCSARSSGWPTGPSPLPRSDGSTSRSGSSATNSRSSGWKRRARCSTRPAVQRHRSGSGRIGTPRSRI